MHCCLTRRKIIKFLCVASNWFFIPSNQSPKQGQLCLLFDFSPLPFTCIWFCWVWHSTQWLCRSALLPPSLLIFAPCLCAGSDSFVLLLLVSLWCQHCEKWLLCPVAETTVDLLQITLSWSCFWERCRAAEQEVQAAFASFINENGTRYRFQMQLHQVYVTAILINIYSENNILGR